jgi:hypothetical protein
MKRAVCARYLIVSGLLAAGGVFACNDDDNDGGGPTSPSVDGGSGSSGSSSGTTQTGTDSGGAQDSASSTPDSGGSQTSDSGDDTTDSGNTASDSGSGDAGTDAATTFCKSQQGLAFCDDFDDDGALSLDAGLASWTSLVSNGTEITTSSAQAVSAPNSMLMALLDGPANTDQSAKVVKMITPANGVTQAVYEFDMYIATVPLAAVGGFATDFQFDDVGGASDQFGFRIGVFANATGFDHADLEHNHPVLGGPDDSVSPIGITAGAWNHVKMSVAYSALADDAGDNVSFQLYINKNATAVVDEQYPAPFAKAPFARFAAGMVYAFDATNKDWGIYYDNFTLKIQ